ncbi:MAG: aminoglycoside phosphotransferase family protein, partial [Flavobacteriaceae bacterium]|nr:aminoglycoside phosphotransferase family protein [Flavobacteriaceae bacterium]
MHKFIQRVIQKELGESVLSIREINGLGSVNQVFDVEGSTANYIIRLNEDPAKQVEYQKEKWCLDKLKTVNVPAPVILAMGMFDKVLFMIQEKIPGINGAYCKPKEKLEIWKQLGQYARKYQHIFQIEDEQVGAAEFHDNWKARLIYNINKLAVADSLLKNGVFNKNQQQIVRIALENLKSKTYKVGLVHGDLSLRNCIWNDGQVYLLDWG